MAWFKNNLVVYNADEVWAAACAAMRINGVYLKQEDTGDVSGIGPTRQNNRKVMYYVLETKSQKPEDFQQGTILREYMQGLLLKQLAGKINDFEKTAMKYANQEEFNNTEYMAFALIACLPSVYERALKADKEQEEMNYLLESSQHIGKINSKVELKIKVLKSIFSQKYMTNFITAVADNNVIFFAYKNALPVNQEFKISGNVKAHRENNQTQLNRVRVK